MSTFFSQCQIKESVISNVYIELCKEKALTYADNLFVFHTCMNIMIKNDVLHKRLH